MFFGLPQHRGGNPIGLKHLLETSVWDSHLKLSDYLLKDSLFFFSYLVVDFLFACLLS